MLSASYRVAVCAFMLVLASCTSPGPPIVDTKVGTRAVPRAAAANIHRYVAKQRGWPPSVYDILQYPYDDGYAVFAIVHRRDEERPPGTGGGKSFAVYCDPHSYRVIKEMGFQ